jgi:Flp pilus assembly protein CpaB
VHATVALRAGVLAQVLLAFGPGAAPEPPLETVTVLVARRYIPAGTVIQEPEKLFKRVRYARGDEPPNAVGRYELLNGTVLARTLAEDQPVKEKDVSLAAPTARPALRPGMRVVVVPVDAGAELAVPQAKADVALVPRRGDPSGRTPETVFRAVTVLAVDRSAPRDGVARPPLVTFLVTPEQARDLIAAQNQGVLSTQLRATPDTRRRSPGSSDPQP